MGAYGPSAGVTGAAICSHSLGSGWTRRGGHSRALIEVTLPQCLVATMGGLQVIVSGRSLW
jgi:hypothetical protein